MSFHSDYQQDQDSEDYQTANSTPTATDYVMAPRNEENHSQTPHPEHQIYSQLAPLQFIKMETVKQGQHLESRAQITTLSSTPRNDEHQVSHAEQQQQHQYIQNFIKMEAAKQEQQESRQLTSLPTTIYGSTLPAQQIIRYESAPCAGGPQVDRYAATAEKEVVMIFNPEQPIISESENKKTFANLGSVTSLAPEFMHSGYPSGYSLPNQLYIQNSNQQFILKNDPSLSSARPSPYTHSMTYETTGEGAYWNGNNTIEFPVVSILSFISLCSITVKRKRS